MRKRRSIQPEEDLLGLAGWMYADLFLALMVIFLATISFVPAITHISVKTPTDQKATTTADFFKAMSRTYTNFDLAQVERDIYAFQTSEGVTPGSAVIYAHFIGGYSKGAETSTDGNFRALVFSQKLATAKSGMFIGMQTHIDASTELSSNQVAVTFTFGPRTGN
ncbi:MAG: hypothetical protein RL414_60 [Actinomycetota bacterium]|jgi:hypothetical protein